MLQNSNVATRVLFIASIDTAASVRGSVFYRRRRPKDDFAHRSDSYTSLTTAPAPILTLIGQTVREIRTERGMTQQQLADLCELHRTFIISIEKSRQNASAITLVRLAAALGVLPLFRAFSKHVMRSMP